MQLNFHTLKQEVLHRLVFQSDPALTYHSAQHTKDVLYQTERIAREEGVTDAKKLLLLKLAALYHDTGFLIAYKEHEENSCALVRMELPRLDVSAEEIATICSMIMATKIPQSPKSRLEEILCDADLDYLGRDDFEEISGLLRAEFFEKGVVQSEAGWMDLQISFLGAHQYFTKTNREQREPKKLRNLKRLISEAAQNTMNK